ncbi:hypothetical protein TRFO_40036 [Tritrichomonas foetus]|uniref:Importin subunit alpha n=1 Tax=Tritrichomonas foetus TaxID=1144522 RepID=A0A1J4J6A9_9EUKA|nr:hypothetical protein TRFO_40036 [Tritrichomonas foetus]|eukprot:OHS93695.1 hypothetical protein TRFO_40036 [Tritrichomonas foetus]
MFFKSSRSQTDLETLDSFGTLNQSGCDMGSYNEELQKQRNSRTISLRQQYNLPSIINAAKATAMKNRITSTSIPPFLSPSYIVSTLQNSTSDINSFQTLLSQIIEYSTKYPRVSKPSLNNSSVVEAFAEVFNMDTLSDQLIITLMKTIACIFPLCDKEYTFFVDSGLILPIYNYLSSPNPELVLNCCSLISTITTFSGYARDSILGMEIHNILSDIAMNENSPPLIVNMAVDAIYHIFANRSQIESEVLNSALPNIVRLLNIKNKVAIDQVIMTLVEMTNKYCYLVITLYEMGLFPYFLSLIDDDDLKSSALCLLGNLCVGHPSQVTFLINKGLVVKLSELMQTGKYPDAFWVYSNLIEAAPQILLPLINNDFLTMLVSVASSSSFELRKEACYLLLTIIIKSNLSEITNFITEPIMDTLSDMLSSGDEHIVLRCIDTLIKFCQAATKDSSIIQSLVGLANSSDLATALSEVIDEDGENAKNTEIVEKAEYLYGQLTSMISQ